MYQERYLEAYHNVINSIVQRFNQPDYMMYAAIQNILLMSILGEDSENEINGKIFKDVSFCTLYKDELYAILRKGYYFHRFSKHFVNNKENE